MALGHTFVLPLLALCSCFLTGLYVIDLISTNHYPTLCEMTYSWPVYTPLTGKVWKRTKHYKYGLYAVHMHQYREELTGLPVLFVPGHMGSYKQARSIARHLYDANDKLFDIFALDFNEELSGLSGNFIQEQAQYINKVIRIILKQYQKQSHVSTKRPDNVIIMAHSMGGIAIQLAQTLSNYKQRSIQHVVSVGSPFIKPIFPFDTDLQHVYSQIETLKPSSTVYISISGGHKDTMVHTSFSLLSSSSSLSLLAPSLVHVHKTIDHLCLLWCHELLQQIATSMVQVIDLNTRALYRDTEERLKIVQTHFLGEETNHTELIWKHEQGLLEGYWDGNEFIQYNLIMPRMLVTFFRTRYITVLVMMYALMLHILYVQLTQWQTKYDLSVSMYSKQAFPSFLTLLDPIAHIPPIIRPILSQSQWNRSIMIIAVSIGIGMKITWNSMIGWEILQLIGLYLYAIGVLYTGAYLLFWLSLLVRPLIYVGSAIARRGVSFKRWVIVALILKLVVLIGHVRNFDLIAFDSSARGLALCVVGCAIVFILHLLELGISASISTPYNDQQRYRMTLFAFYFLSIVPWIGKLATFVTIIQTPPPQLDHDVVFQAISCIVIFGIFSLFIVRTKDEMLPLPPAAFFDETTSFDQDDKQSITAENCPRCIYQDGGSGAIFIEYQDSSTRCIQMSTGEIVRMGTTFRVISCDCVYRCQQPLEYCAFCTRACRLCGGGNGNYQEAQRFQEYLNQYRTLQALQSVIGTIVEGCAWWLILIQNTEHYVFYMTPMITILLLCYHIWLRHPNQVKRSCHRTLKKKKKHLNKPSPSKKKILNDGSIFLED